MNQLLLHPQTEKAIKQLLASPPHAIMLTGNEGSGKLFTALTLAREILGVSPDTHPYFFHFEPAGKSFTIEQVRDLQKVMKLKTTGLKAIRRIAVLQDIHTMTTEAQNALLKLLEEPPEDTILILTAQGDRSLKPTIYSRVQTIHLKPVPKSELMKSFTAGPALEIERFYALSGGNAGLFMALVGNATEHPLVKSIETAKALISSTAFERLTKVDELAKDKDELRSLLSALKRISRAALSSAASKQDPMKLARWSNLLKAVYGCDNMLVRNVNPKLLLTELFLTM